MKRQTTTLCVVARDEEARIGQAIKSALAVVDEIVVADTGSQDNTRLIAEGYGARVVDVPWRDDFAAARNAALDEARCDWVLVLDADERLQPVRPVEFQKMLTDEAVAGYNVRIEDREQESGRSRPSCPLRLFRSHPHIRYCYPIHERVGIAVRNWAASRGMDVAESVLTVVHERGDAAETRSRRDGYRRLLESAVAEYPWEPYFAFRLADETMVLLEDEILPTAGLRAALVPLERAWRALTAEDPDAASRMEHGPDLAIRLSGGYLALGRMDEARNVVDRAAAIYPGDGDLRFQRAVVTLRDLPDPSDAGASPAEAVARAQEAAKVFRDALLAAAGGEDPDPAPPSRRSLHASCHLGETALWRGNLAEARAHFERVLAADRSCSPAWLGLGDCARSAGDPRRALGMYLRAVTVNERNHIAWLRGSSVLAQLGFNDNAASWRRRVLNLFPEHPLRDRLTDRAASRPEPAPV